MQDDSSDHEERIRDFFARHGGPGRPGIEEETNAGQQGWSEVYANDGYVLRCEWSKLGTRDAMSYIERAP